MEARQVDSFAVIGHPIGHTMSPYIHRRLFEYSNKSADYITLDIAPENLAKEFGSTLRNLSGFNITIPHKQAVISLLDRLDDTARLYGAVNCVRCGKFTEGFNTDAFGFKAAIASRGIPLAGKVLLLGSGGAARTVAYEAALADCELTVAARSESGAVLAEEILKKTGKQVYITSYNDIDGGYDLVVNATPVGMYPKAGASPLRDDQLNGCKALFDAVYNPRETELIKQARRHGMKIAEGMAMLVWQAIRAHEIWYGAHFTNEQADDIINGANIEMQRIFGGRAHE